jgi:alpha-ketoglutarate-dependent taurine dioxygenase
MEYLIQQWSDRDLQPLVNNNVDLIVIKNAPASQLKLFKFLEEYYEIAPQDPMDKIFLDITLSGVHHELYGNTDLEWHIDKGYTQKPVNVTGLYGLEIEGNAGRTLYVDNRIECPIDNKMITVDMERFTSNERYGYKFRSEAERRWFRMKHKDVWHPLVQEDKKGQFVYYCEAYTELPDAEKQAIEKLLYDASRIYYHEWEKGDFVVVNNIATNHKREPTQSGKRHLWKIEGYIRQELVEDW